MTTAISKLRGMGYHIELEGEEIVCRWQGEGVPDREAVTPLLAELRERKAAILEDYTERAGIMEFDGGFPRPEAERLTWECLTRPQEEALSRDRAA